MRTRTKDTPDFADRKIRSRSESYTLSSYISTINSKASRLDITNFDIKSKAWRTVYSPRIFTGHEAVMDANVLNSKIAVQASILLVTVFVRLKELATEHSELKRRLFAMEQRVTRGETFSRPT